MSLRQFGASTAIYAAANVGGRAASFLLIPLYVRALSMTEYGCLATLLFTVQVLLTLVDLGMRTGLLRFTMEYRDKQRIGELLGTSSLVSLLSGLVVTIILLAFLRPYFRNLLRTGLVSWYMVLVCVAALAQSLSLHVISYFRALNQPAVFMVAHLMTAMLLLVANYLALRVLRGGVAGVLVAHCVTYSVAAVLVSCMVFSGTGIAWSRSLAAKLLRFGFPLGASAFAQIIMGGAGFYLLGYFVGLDAVAVYSLGYKFAQILGIVVILPFQLALQPYVFSHLGCPDLERRLSRLLTFLLWITVIGSLIVLAGSRIIIPLIAPPEYSGAFVAAIWLVPAMGFIGLYYFGATLLSAAQKTLTSGLAVGACLVLSILLNGALIPQFGWQGAACALVASYVVLGITTFTLGRRAFPMVIEWKGLAVGACLFLTALLLNLTLSDEGATLYFVVNIPILLAGSGLSYLALSCGKRASLDMRPVEPSISLAPPVAK